MPRQRPSPAFIARLPVCFTIQSSIRALPGPVSKATSSPFRANPCDIRHAADIDEGHRPLRQRCRRGPDDRPAPAVRPARLPPHQRRADHRPRAGRDLRPGHGHRPAARSAAVRAVDDGLAVKANQVDRCQPVRRRFRGKRPGPPRRASVSAPPQPRPARPAGPSRSVTVTAAASACAQECPAGRRHSHRCATARAPPRVSPSVRSRATSIPSSEVPDIRPSAAMGWSSGFDTSVSYVMSAPS